MNAWPGGVNPVAVRRDYTQRSLALGRLRLPPRWVGELKLALCPLMLTQSDPRAAAVLVDELDPCSL